MRYHIRVRVSFADSATSRSIAFANSAIAVRLFEGAAAAGE
jgi:hypothetical protein